MFPLADTLHLPVFPSLRFQRNRTTFLNVSIKFPSKETGVSASVNAWNLAKTRDNVPESSQFHVSVNVIVIGTIAEIRVYESETGVFKLFPL